MYRIDNSTAVPSIPTPGAAGTQGFFTNGNAVTGSPATIVDADFLNRIQEELMFPLSQVGLAASKTSAGQSMQAYRRMFGGNVYTVTTSVALTLDQAGLIVISSGTNILVVLPAAAGVGSLPLRFTFVNLTGNTVTLQGAGTDVIETTNTISLPAGGRIALLSNGSSVWYTIATNINGSTQPRIKLAPGGTTLNLYVSTTGNDLNNGLTSGAPKATIQAAWDMLQSYDINGQSVVINLANGTYTAGMKATGLVGVSSPSGVTIQGNTGSPSSVIVNITNGNCFQSVLNGCLNVTGMTLQASGTGGNGICLYASQGGQMTFQTVVFGNAGNCHIFANVSGLISATGSYTINNNAPMHVQANSGGVFFGGGVTVTVTGTPAFSNAFGVAAACGVLNPGGMSFTGSATGTRYLASYNGVVVANGVVLPGSVAGTLTTGGQYS